MRRLQWAIEQQRLVVEAADAKLRWAERMLTQARTERAVVEAHNRADAALLDVEMAEERLHQLGQQTVNVVTAVSRPTGQGSRVAQNQAPLFDVR